MGKDAERSLPPSGVDARRMLDRSFHLNFYRAHRALTRRLDARLKASRLTGEQAFVLATIDALPEARSADVANFLGKDHSTIVGNLRSLVAQDLVSVRTDPSDKRGRILSLTETGQARLLTASPIIIDVDDRFEERAGITVIAAARLALTVASEDG